MRYALILIHAHQITGGTATARFLLTVEQQPVTSLDQLDWSDARDQALFAHARADVREALGSHWIVAEGSGRIVCHTNETVWLEV